MLLFSPPTHPHPTPNWVGVGVCAAQTQASPAAATKQQQARTKRAVSAAAWLTLGEDPLIELDVVEHRAQAPVLHQRVAGHLAVVHHACKWRNHRTR